MCREGALLRVAGELRWQREEDDEAWVNDGMCNIRRTTYGWHERSTRPRFTKEDRWALLAVELWTRYLAVDRCVRSRPGALKRARLYELNAAHLLSALRLLLGLGLVVLAVGNSSTPECCRHRSIDQQREGGPSRRSLGGKPRGGVRTVDCEVQIIMWLLRSRNGQ